MNLDQLTAVGLALGLGLLVGLQREHAAKAVGIRTFALITLLGAICGLMLPHVGVWLGAAGLGAVAAATVLPRVGMNRSMSREDDKASHMGTTTDIAALVMYVVGLMLGVQMVAIALIVGGLTAILLQMKQPLHDWVGRLESRDWRAIFQFALITLVILPVLPNRRFGPPGYEVLNPYKIWLMVVLIVAISLGAYVAYKLLGGRRGTLVGGILGGLISSTATTVSFSRMAKESEGVEASVNNAATKNSGATDYAGLGAVVIMLATAVVNVRVLVLMGAVSQDMLSQAWGPVAAMMGWMCVVCIAGYWLMRPAAPDQQMLPGNPAQLKMAIFFAAMYAVVLLAAAFAREHLGDQGLYAVGAVSGLTDLDAITLSMANMVNNGKTEIATGWRVIVVATVANLLFKAGIAGVMGGRALFWRVAAMFAAVAAGCAALLIFWPG